MKNTITSTGLHIEHINVEGSKTKRVEVLTRKEYLKESMKMSIDVKPKLLPFILSFLASVGIMMTIAYMLTWLLFFIIKLSKN
tara:strand:+ start:6898 stop:7146 length:249 start_codon:yes stop_codon:yes gene_type:complete